MINVFIKGFECGPVATIAYLVADEAACSAIVIDVSYGSAELLAAEAEKNNFTIEKIILTHTHWDHTADVKKLRDRVGAPVLVHRADEHRLTDPTEKLFCLPFVIPPIAPDGYLEEKNIVRVGKYSFEIFHTPGHTEGGIMLYEKNEGVAFVGDTLFAGSIGRTDLPGGDTEILIESIHTKIFSLPSDVVLYPGHGVRTTVGKEKAVNPFVGAFA